MKTYKPTYTDKKTGKKKKCSHYYLTFIDNRQIRRRLPMFSDKRASERAEEKIEQLLSCGGVLDQALQKWIESLPQKQRDRLLEWGIVGSQRVSANLGKLLSEHLADFHKALLAKENGKRYARQVASKVESIFDACGFRLWSDLDANRVYTYLADLRKESGIGQRTFNYYLKAAKQFCKWMIKERRASGPNPLEHLSCIKQTEKRLKRRALTLDEQRKLLAVTAEAEPHHNMSGCDRSYLYRLALETGLRAGELKSLTKSSFDFDECTVTVQAGYTKNKETAVIDLKRRTAAEMQILLENKEPDMKVFAMPDQPAKMIKKDLKAAGIPYRNDEGQADFHALRHSFITNLARQGVHPGDAQELARHSTITLTMDHYTHSKRESLQKIIQNQPDLTDSGIGGLSSACLFSTQRLTFPNNNGQKKSDDERRTAFSA